MKASDLETYLVAMIRAKRNVLVTGSPGIGKTAIEVQAAQKAEADNFLMYPSTGNPTDAKGFPWLFMDAGKPNAEFVPFGELKGVFEAIDAGKLVALFLDDLGQGAPATQASYMSLMDKLRGQCAVIAATNRRGDKAGVQGVLEPVKSRFHSIVEMIPDLDDFTNLLLDKGEKVYGLTEEAILDGVGYLRWRPENLCNFKATADMVNSPCPRTWIAGLQQVSMSLPALLEAEALMGAISEGVAGEFIIFKKMRHELPNLDSILKDPKNAPISDQSNIRWAVCTGLASKVTKANFPAIHIYAQRLYEANYGPWSALLVKDCTRRTPEIMETKEFEKLAYSDTIGALIAGR